MTAVGYNKYEAFIVDSDLDSRMRLKQATSSVHNFGKVQQIAALKEAVSKLSGPDKCDVVFISYKFDQSEVTQFIKEAKQTPHGQDAAYVLVLRGQDQDSQTVASNVMIGADGFLFEPYSVDNLIEITSLAARVKRERSKSREAAALKFLITDVMNQVDLIAFLKQSGYEVGRSLKKFKDLCGVFQTLEGDSKDLYFELAIKMFEEAPLPKTMFQNKKYAGASSRVKRLAEKKVMAELEKKGIVDKEDIAAMVEDSSGEKK